MRPSVSIAAAMIMAAALGDRAGIGESAPVDLTPRSHSGHGSRRGNKAPHNYTHDKRRRQIARASRQLNRRRSA